MCVGKIVDIDASTGWWYNACTKCKFGVTNYEGVLSCRKCGPIEQLPMPWYKLNIQGTDTTVTATFLIFGKIAEKMLKIPATILSDLPGSNRTIVPPIMKEICGKIYNFTVSINNRNNDGKLLTFSVSQANEEQQYLEVNDTKDSDNVKQTTTQSPQSDEDNDKKEQHLSNDSTREGNRKRNREFMQIQDKDSEDKDLQQQPKSAISKGKRKI
ncbi:uncharacterized protein LOC119996917 [Tripterygium wilfordii]|uniref:uncharacterized protein LOC119996917 n=1 Tax=Tripterygium wilfordii TaxID=458696 RepID=UPI0018F7FBC7|nr:uncharacterized protein LOC119996917 [Tripterygium wilfordii]